MQRYEFFPKYANKKQDFGKNNAFFADIFRNVVF